MRNHYPSFDYDASKSKQVRSNDVWTCVACGYLIYKKLT